MMALCVQARAEEGGGAPSGGGDDTSAAADHRTKASQEAEGLYVQAMRAKDEGRLDDAVKLLDQATRLEPGEQKYRKASDDVRAMAGVNRDSRSVTIDRVADEFAVKQQQLWVEAQAKIEEGQRQMEAGEYDEAERSFQMAQTRLETLPYADERKEPELRRVGSLRSEAQNRREHAEQESAAERNRQAVDRQRELRDMSLRIERDRIDAMLARAERARQRRDFDEAILLCEQVLKINRAEGRAASLLSKCRRERHVYLRQMTADRWDEEHKLLSEQIRTAMLPQLEIIKYSADWPQIDARRSAPARGLEGEEDKVWQKTINDQLEQEIHVDFVDTDLADVVQFLQRVSNVNIVVDQQVLVNAPPPVNLTADRMKLRFVLDLIMKLTGLNYVLRDEAIFISNTEGVRGDLITKLYDIHDLTHAMQSFPGPDLDIPEPGGQGAKLLPPVEPEAHPEANEFIEIVQKVVAPNLWQRDGVAISEYQGSMVVTQTSDVHRQIEQLLRDLRNQKGTQIHVKVRFLEVENSALEEIGMDWNNYTGPRDPAALGRPPLPGMGLTPGNNNSLGAYYGDRPNNIITAAALNNQLQPYQTANSLTYNPLSHNQGMVFQTQTWQLNSNWYVSAVLHAVEQERRGNIVYEPDITMFNGQQAHIVHMNQQSYIADYDVVQGQYDPIVTILSYGTVLDVQAIASDDKKYITLTLRPTNAQVVEWRRFGPLVTNFPGGTVVNGGNGNGNGTNQPAPGIAGNNPLLVPELKYESVRTSVTIPDGGSLIIAGMTNGESARSHSGIPFLSHIPFLGRLFSTNGSQETERRTLIIVQADLVLFDEIEKNL
jgi:general secretion pathway protein D